MNKKQGASGQDFFSPVMEGIVELVQSFIDLIITTVSPRILEGFKFLKGQSSKKFQIENKMLQAEKQVVGEADLGWSINQKGVYDTSKLQSHLHTFIIGASGWGKSNLMNILMEKDLKADKPVIFIDPKGTLAGIQEFLGLCKLHGRKAHVFSEHYGTMDTFNPFLSMNSDQALIMIMRSFNWGTKPNEYYLRCSEMALKKTLDKLYSERSKFGLKEVYKELLLSHDQPETKGLLNQFHLLVNSTYGHLFDQRGDKDAISFQGAWERKECIYIGVSTMGYGTLAKTVAKLFLSELQTLAHIIGTTQKTQQEAISKSIGVYIDEAGSILFQDFIDLANKARSSGINLTVAVQSYSDMEMVSQSKTLMEQLMECFSTWFIQRQLHPDNAERLASIFGTFLSEKKTVVTEGGAESTKGSLREGQEYVCHPDIIKSLRVGQAVLLTLNPKDVHLLNIRDSKFKSRLQIENPKVADLKRFDGKKPLSTPLGENHEC